MDLEEEMLRMADEICLFKRENRELNKRVLMAEDDARKTDLEEEPRGYKMLDAKIQFRTLVTAVA